LWLFFASRSWWPLLLSRVISACLGTSFILHNQEWPRRWKLRLIIWRELHHKHVKPFPRGCKDTQI
jgi:hypothetical protein